MADQQSTPTPTTTPPAINPESIISAVSGKVINHRQALETLRLVLKDRPEALGKVLANLPLREGEFFKATVWEEQGRRRFRMDILEGIDKEEYLAWLPRSTWLLIVRYSF